MIEISKLHALRSQLKHWRGSGETLGLVPTMGNLHEGHLELVRLAKQRADRCVVSIFVNPMQFGVGEDFGSYPRTYAEDRRKLLEVGADLLFAPGVEDVYPKGDREQTRVEVPGLSDILCGASRPGHFVGVATVVCKLFNMIQPDLAVFGEKDFQQLMVIRQMVSDLCIPLDVIGAATFREPDGLAKSSRNSYLNNEERIVANCLYRTILNVSTAIQGGSSDYQALQQSAVAELEEAGFRADYFTIRRAADLAMPGANDRELVILGAAWLGRTRLIDNLRVTREILD